MNVTIWEAEPKIIDVDIGGFPEELITKFREMCEKKFGVRARLYDYLTDACKDADRRGQHITVTICGFQRKQFHDFLARFCAKYDLTLSPLNAEAFR